MLLVGGGGVLKETTNSGLYDFGGQLLESSLDSTWILVSSLVRLLGALLPWFN